MVIYACLKDALMHHDNARHMAIKHVEYAIRERFMVHCNIVPTSHDKILQVTTEYPDGRKRQKPIYYFDARTLPLQ
jgi:hypothetical protein